MVEQHRMETTSSKHTWCVVGHSERGSSHVRSGLPNQDSIHWSPESGLGPPLLVAVSDGHGSAKSFRSDVGSHLATASMEIAWSASTAEIDSVSITALKHWTEETLPNEVIRHWRNAVADDLSKRPFTCAEIETLETKGGTKEGYARRQVVLDPLRAYGATLLSVIVTDSFIVYLQLGDGDILNVSESGEVSRALNRDERLLANETTSLCLPDAWRQFIQAFQVMPESPPALILLSSDGYANSFQTEQDFFKVGSDLLELIRNEGIEEVENNLERWLLETSEAGSGDDVTLGLICRLDAVK